MSSWLITLAEERKQTGGYGSTRWVGLVLVFAVCGGVAVGLADVVAVERLAERFEE